MWAYINQPVRGFPAGFRRFVGRRGAGPAWQDYLSMSLIVNSIDD